MRRQNNLLLLFAVLLTLLIAVACASKDSVDRLEIDIRALENQVSQQIIQQQNIDTNVAQRLSAISERMESIDQRLSNLEAVDSALSQSIDDLSLQISELENELENRISAIEGKLDDRAINRILANPLSYLVAIAILLLGLSIGVWVSYCRTRRQKPVKANADEVQEETVEDTQSQNT